MKRIGLVRRLESRLLWRRPGGIRDSLADLRQRTGTGAIAQDRRRRVRRAQGGVCGVCQRGQGVHLHIRDRLGATRSGHFGHDEQRRPARRARQSQRRRGGIQERLVTWNGQRDRVDSLLGRRLHRIVVRQHQRRDRG